MIARLYALYLSETVCPSGVVPIEFHGDWLGNDDNLKEAIKEVEKNGKERGGVSKASLAVA